MKKVLFENQEIIFELENGIIIGTFKKDYIDLSTARNITNYRLEAQKGDAYPLLSNIKSIKQGPKEARDFLASEKGCEGVLAAAVLIDSPLGSMIGNFFIKINKPFVLTKIFSDEKAAKNWLLKCAKKD